MIRVLVIDGDRALGQSLAMECLEQGLGVRMAETLCEGVRYLLEAPVSVVLVEAQTLRLSGPDHARLFDAVAPGIPVVVMVGAAAPVEERVGLELQGFQVVARPFVLRDLLTKVAEAPGKRARSRPGAAARVEAVCG